MGSDKMQVLTNMTTRQKITIAAIIVVMIIVLWQVIGLFGGGKTPTITSAANKSAMTNKNQPMGPPPQPMPQPAQIKPASAQPMSPREMELMKLQEETQAKYINALNELQMLKVAREIAETNQAIVISRLATVTAEKNIVTMLSGPSPQVASAAYAKGLVNPTAASAAPVVTQPEVTYTAISVSQLHYRWNAVIGYAGNLYNVSVGDVLPADGSLVISIDKSGVMLEKAGVKRKISLVPII